MNNFKAEPAEIKEAMVAASRRVIESGWFVLGEEVISFEKKWASACGVSFGIGVGNGMDAIEIALRSLNIGFGDEVITTPMTAFASVLAILRSGATPVLADIDPSSALLSLESVQRCLSSKTKAIVLVHLYGQVRDMNSWLALCATEKVHLIEDCAQSHLATWDGSVAGSFGTAGAYSFYPTKNLGAIGDGGMLVTNDSQLAEKAQRLRNYGQSARYEHPELGMNSRLDEIQAALLSVRMEWLAEFTNNRRLIADAYRLNINNPIVKLLSAPQQPNAHVHHLFVVSCIHRAKLQKYLSDYGVQSLIHYPIPIHHQQTCLRMNRDPMGLTNSEAHSEDCLSLPCHPFMTVQEIEKVINCINLFKLN